MKINRSSKSQAAARAIIAYLNGDESAEGRQDPIVSLSEDGDLLFYNAACGTDDSETVLIARFEPDSMGEGWESATVTDVFEFLESNCNE
jgi:hypothetical protein